MGCDIHAHIEVKLNDKWEHWHAPQIDRYYKLFGRLAGVRCPDEPHPPVRGLPNDITTLTKWDYDLTFGHTASWITYNELNKVQQWVEEQQECPPGHGWHKVIGYLGGNGYFPYDEITDIRMVFWFDN